MDWLITGVGGLLGSNVVSTAANNGHEVLGTYHTSEPNLPTRCRKLNITDSDAFRELVDEHTPDVVVNCAAMTDVDGCESKPGLANEVNGRAPGEMATICAEREIAFVQVSTDYLFDGKKETKYREDADPNPLQVYGQSKLKGEHRVLESHPSPLVVRLSFVYGVHSSTDDLEGFPDWVISRLGTKEKVPLFTDQCITPSRAGHVAATILDLAKSDLTGTYNVACSECITPYEFGEAICAQVGADISLLTESTTSDVTRIAPRPAYTCLDIEKVQNHLGCPQPKLSEDLRAIRSALEAKMK